VIARIRPIDGGFSLPCAIIDISEGGARVRFSQTVHLPAHFHLVDERDGLVYTASLVWSAAPDYGLKFIRKDPLSPELSSAAGRGAPEAGARPSS
jgi:hypothetical protein